MGQMQPKVNSIGEVKSKINKIETSKSNGKGGSGLPANSKLTGKTVSKP